MNWKIRSTTRFVKWQGTPSPSEPLYWSKEVGWTYKDQADVFTAAEKAEEDMDRFPPYRERWEWEAQE